MIYFYCLYFFTIYSTLFSEIFEVKHFSEITRYILPETLVLLDIDDTLLIPTQTLGTDVWFIYRLKHYQAQENDWLLALDKALADWEAIRHLTQVKIVEEGTDKIISQLQKNHVTVMGLTTQGLALATRTIHQLNSLHIDLLKTAPSHEDHYFMNQQGVLYRQGILFTSGTVKGMALLKLLDKIDYRPRHIVFINDKEAHLRDVEKSVLAKGMDFIGLRYAYCDERVSHFQPFPLGMAA